MDDFPVQAKNVTKTFTMKTASACAKYQVRIMKKVSKNITDRQKFLKSFLGRHWPCLCQISGENDDKKDLMRKNPLITGKPLMA